MDRLGADDLAGLGDFQRRRLDLADMLRAVLAVAHACGDERRERDIRSLLTRLAAGRFQLAVVGQFSRGKTTLMNALLGGPYLPTGALPTTAVITTIRYGTRARALVRSHASALPVEVPVTEVAGFVAEASADRVRMRVTAVEVELPAELLRLGFEFVDTPGVGSANAANTAVTLRYLPQADAVVFVTGFDSALTEAEADFLVRAAGQVGGLFLVVNKRDLVAASQADEVTWYVQRWARQHLDGVQAQVFGLSALDALQSAVRADPDGLARSGIEQFRAALVEFLTTEQGRASLRAIAKAAADITSRERRDLSAGRIADEGLDPATVTARFDTRMNELQDRLSATADGIAESVAAAMPGLLAERDEAWRTSLGELVGPTAAPPPDAGVDAEPQVEVTLEALRTAGRQAVAGWLGDRAAELRAAILGVTGNGISALLNTADLAREQGSELAGLPTFGSGLAGWSADDVPDLLVPAVEWVVPEPPGRGWRGRRGSGDDLARVLSGCLSAAIDSFVRRAGAAFGDSAADWAARLRDQAVRHARAEADQFRRYLLNPPRRQDAAVLSGVSARLAQYSAALDSPLAGSPTLSSPTLSSPAVVGGQRPSQAGREQAAGPAAEGGHDRPCDICRRQAAALSDYLVGRQFLLATSEEEQARHATAGGFCPLHTWQYARLASPVGLSAGNARLAAAVAGKLAAAGSSAGSADRLAQEAAAIASRPACAACAVLADTEQQVAAEVAARAEPADLPALCLHHLSLVLEIGPTLEVGSAMVCTLAQALQRASADMRSYALKREALRRGLITDDENQAYRDALALLVGLPELALPSEPD